MPLTLRLRPTPRSWIGGMMIWMVLALAHASCMRVPEQTWLTLRTLAPDQPIMARSTWGSGAHLARRLRLRGPDNKLVAVRREVLGPEVRLIPKRSLDLGIYQVEERGGYAVDGRRLYEWGDGGDHQGWFGSWEVEVVPAVARGEAPSVEWRVTEETGPRYRHPPPPLLMAEVTTDDQASWVELEVEGLGVVDTQTWSREGIHRVSTLGVGRCGDRGNPQDGLGELTARVVAHGPAGWKASSPWTTLGTPDESAGSPKLATWRRVRGGRDARPTQRPVSTCARLESVGIEELTDARVLIDEDGSIHRVAMGAEGTLLDGTINVENARAIASHDGSLFVAQHGRLSRFDSGVEVASFELPAGEISIQLNADAEGVVARWVDGDGRRLRQHFSLELVPQDVPSAIEYPIFVKGDRGGWRVNGHWVEGDMRRHWVSERHVAFRTSERDVVVYNAQGNLVLEVPVPEGMWLERVGVDAEGVKMALLTDDHASKPSVTGVDWEGAPIPVLELPPAPDPIQWQRTEFPFREGKVMRVDRRISVRDGDGQSSSAIPAHGWFGVDGEHVVTGWSGRDSDGVHVLRMERFACREGRGVPEHWVP